MRLIFKILRAGEWRQAQQSGVFAGSEHDARDGFIHFSTAAQARETARKHFAGETDLVLAAVDADALGPALTWEPSRGGALFPHLYAALPLDRIVWTKPLPLAQDGLHLFPELA
ncbi:MAG: DUF952 domain-containing protein [Rhizobiales bacterium]|nr:DUF952 domain-containing protein [Hyphomicrobiales bacterium]